MPYKFADRLRARGQELAAALNAAGIEAAIIEDSFRDYTVKLRVGLAGRDYGAINLYYSPKRNAYTCSLHQIKQKALAPRIEAVWQQIDGGKTTNRQKIREDDMRGLRAYVDGSHIKGRVGYGAVILRDGEEIARFSGRVTEDTSSQQVAGELVAVLTVLDYCEANDIGAITIYYDYTGIAHWAKGTWKANLPLTQRYAAAVRQSPVKVTWRKVRSHSGDTWNDLADKLARDGAQQPAT